MTMAVPRLLRGSWGILQVEAAMGTEGLEAEAEVEVEALAQVV